MNELPNLSPSSDSEELIALGESLMRRQISKSDLMNAESLIRIDDGVQIFNIDSDSRVITTSQSTSLRIVRLQNEPQPDPQHGQEILIRDWVYPLIPGVSPVMHTNYDAYIFPDLTASQPDSSVGIKLPDSLSSETKQKFDDIIKSHTAFREQPPEAGTSTDGQSTSGAQESKNETAEQKGKSTVAGKISKGILAVAETLAQNVEKGAKKTEEFIKDESQKFQQQSKPSEEPCKIDPKLLKGVTYARDVTGETLKASDYVVNRVEEVTVHIAKELAPHFEKHGMRKDGQGTSTVKDVVLVAGSGLKGFDRVYGVLDTAARSLGRCLANETVGIIKHKYGEEAGSLAENTVSATSNLIVTSQNVGSLGKTAVAKQVAKKTGKIVIDDLSSDVDKENLFVVVETSVDDKQEDTRFKTSGSEV